MSRIFVFSLLIPFSLIAVDAEEKSAIALVVEEEKAAVQDGDQNTKGITNTTEEGTPQQVPRKWVKKRNPAKHKIRKPSRKRSLSVQEDMPPSEDLALQEQEEGLLSHDVESDQEREILVEGIKSSESPP